MSTVQEVVKNYLTTLGVDYAYSRGAVSSPKWAEKSNDWRVTVKRGPKRFDIDYFTSNLADEPNLPDVIHSLISDKETISGRQSFEDWCYELGYNDDSITDLNTYNAIIENTGRLEVMFTPEELSVLSRFLEDY